MNKRKALIVMATAFTFCFSWTPPLFEVLAASPEQGAVLEFVSTGPTTVSAGTPVVFDLTISTNTLPEFQAADALIGCDGARFTFEYSDEWLESFAFIQDPRPMGVYAHDLYVGGFAINGVGSTFPLGTITVDTRGLSTGSYALVVNSSISPGQASVALGVDSEPLDGQTVFTVIGLQR